MINSTTSTDRTVRADAVGLSGPATPRPIAPRPDRLSTESAARLRVALSEQPEIRPEVVERGRALAADPSYPSADTLRKVGGLILNTPDLSEDAS